MFDDSRWPVIKAHADVQPGGRTRSTGLIAGASLGDVIEGGVSGGAWVDRCIDMATAAVLTARVHHTVFDDSGVAPPARALARRPRLAPGRRRCGCAAGKSSVGWSWSQ